MNVRVFGRVQIESGFEYGFIHRASCTKINCYTHRCRIIHLPSCLRHRLEKNTYSAMMPYMNYVIGLAIIELRDFAPYEIGLCNFYHYTGSALCYCSSAVNDKYRPCAFLVNSSRKRAL